MFHREGCRDCGEPFNAAKRDAVRCRGCAEAAIRRYRLVTARPSSSSNNATTTGTWWWQEVTTSED